MGRGDSSKCLFQNMLPLATLNYINIIRLTLQLPPHWIRGDRGGRGGGEGRGSQGIINRESNRHETELVETVWGPIRQDTVRVLVVDNGY